MTEQATETETDIPLPQVDWRTVDPGSLTGKSLNAAIATSQGYTIRCLPTKATTEGREDKWQYFLLTPEGATVIKGAVWRHDVADEAAALKWLAPNYTGSPGAAWELLEEFERKEWDLDIAFAVPLTAIRPYGAEKDDFRIIQQIGTGMKTTLARAYLAARQAEEKGKVSG